MMVARITLLAHLVVLIIISSGQALESRIDSDRPSLYVRYASDADELLVYADHVRFSAILKSIEHYAGCRIFLETKTDPYLTTDVLNLPLEQGIKKVSNGFGLIVVYAENKKIIDEVWVFEDAALHRSPYVQSQGAPPVVSSSAVLPEAELSEGSFPRPSTRNIEFLDKQVPDETTPLGFWTRRLSEDQHPDNRAQAVTELGRMDNEDALNVIAALLGHEDTALRHHVVEEIKTMQHKDAPIVLGQVMFNDPDPVLRRSAVRYFAQGTHPLSLVFLKAALNDADKGIQYLAKESLKYFE